MKYKNIFLKAPKTQQGSKKLLGSSSESGWESRNISLALGVTFALEAFANLEQGAERLLLVLCRVGAKARVQGPPRLGT